MKEEWRIRYEHERDTVIAWCRAEGVPVPKMRDGEVVRPENYMRRFNGLKFWEEFKKLGHDHAEYDRCSCRNK